MNDKLEKNFVSAVVYIHNHASYIEMFTQNLVKVLQDNFEKFEVIFVNDYSEDNSVEIIKQIIKEMKGISSTIIHMSYYQGLEAAMVAGVDIAIGDFVYEFDSPVVDYAGDQILQIYRQALQGYDVVSASPESRRRFTSKIFYNIFKHYSKNNIELSTERFRIISRRGINRINMLSTVIPYRKAIYFNCGLRAVNLQYKVTNMTSANKQRRSQLCWERMELAVDSLLLFTDICTKLSILLAAIMFLFAMSVVGYSLFVYLTHDKVVEGWTTIMIFSSVSFTGVFAILAIIIKYISLSLNIQHRKQVYVFESVEKLKQ